MSWEKSKRQIVPPFGGLEDATQQSLIRVFGLVQKKNESQFFHCELNFLKK